MTGKEYNYVSSYLEVMHIGVRKELFNFSTHLVVLQLKINDQIRTQALHTIVLAICIVGLSMKLQAVPGVSRYQKIGLIATSS